MTSTCTRSLAIAAALMLGIGITGCTSDSVTAGVKAGQGVHATQEADAAAVVDQDDAADEAQPAEADGSRNNPWPIGTQLTSDDWEVEVGATNLDANGIVADGNMFNDAPDEGFQYIQVPVTVTYIGDESANTMEVQISYVAATGETYDSTSALVAVPDSNDYQELYTGGTASFNEYLMVPVDGIGDGLIRVDLGLFGGERGFFTLS